MGTFQEEAGFLGPRMPPAAEKSTHPIYKKQCAYKATGAADPEVWKSLEGSKDPERLLSHFHLTPGNGRKAREAVSRTAGQLDGRTAVPEVAGPQGS